MAGLVSSASSEEHKSRLAVPAGLVCGCPVSAGFQKMALEAVTLVVSVLVAVDDHCHCFCLMVMWHNCGNAYHQINARLTVRNLCL